jgi:hypothetical protein
MRLEVLVERMDASRPEKGLGAMAGCTRPLAAGFHAALLRPLGATLAIQVRSPQNHPRKRTKATRKAMSTV